MKPYAQNLSGLLRYSTEEGVVVEQMDDVEGLALDAPAIVKVLNTFHRTNNIHNVLALPCRASLRHYER